MGSETDENYANGSGSNGTSNRVGTGDVSERGGVNGNDHRSNNTSSGISRQSTGTSSQQSYQPDFGPWTQAVHEAVQSMGATHKAIKDLHEQFTLHIDDLRMIPETQKRLSLLEVECRGKDEELMMQENTITTLTRIDQKAKEDIERKRETIEKEKHELDQEKQKLEKRVDVATAEQRLILTRDFGELTKQHTESYEKLREKLEDEFARKKDENDRRVTALEAENKQLSTTVEEQKRTIDSKAKELDKSTDQCDMLKRAKDSFKRDMQALEEELENMKKEFALSPKPKNYLYVF
jgi:chromosome segregation ATPase